MRHEGSTCRVATIETVARLSFATRVRTLLQQGPEGGPRHGARADAAGDFISGVKVGRLSSCCLWIYINAVTNACVKAFTNGTNLFASSHRL